MWTCVAFLAAPFVSWSIVTVGFFVVLRLLKHLSKSVERLNGEAGIKPSEEEV